MKKIVLTGGGTSGHVTPNISLIPKLREKGFEISYIGSYNGMEKQLIGQTGVEYYPIQAGKLRRYFDLKNVSDVFRVMRGFTQALSVLGRIKPDVVFSKGGFVSCPVVWAAWFRKIPVVIHESDMTPGLTNRLSIPFARKVCYTFPETEKYIPTEKGVLTGLPIREELKSGDKSTGLGLCGFDGGKPVLMVIGGSQGAESINKTVRQALPALLADFQVCHICGKGNAKPEYDGTAGYRQFEYAGDELKNLYAITDLAVSRAGATTLFELLALRKPNLLVPLPNNASRGDQILNAESFQKQGCSAVLPEEKMTAESLTKGIGSLWRDREKYIRAMGGRRADSVLDAVIKTIEEAAE